MYLLPSFLLRFFLFTLLLISPIQPRPILEPLWENASKVFTLVAETASNGFYKMETAMSNAKGPLFNRFSVWQPNVPKFVMRNSIQIAMENPKLTAPLAIEIGKAGAMAFVANKENGLRIVEACNEGMWEVISQAIKEYFDSLKKSISRLRTQLQNTFFSRLPGFDNLVSPPAAASVPKVVAAPIENTKPTTVQSVTLFFKSSWDGLVEFGRKGVDSGNQGVVNLLRWYAKGSAESATSGPKRTVLFGNTAQTYAKSYVNDPNIEVTTDIAREFGRITAREFLRSPAVASEVIYNVASGAVPIMYKEYTVVFSKFVDDLAVLAEAIPTEATKQALNLARMIQRDMFNMVDTKAAAAAKASVGVGAGVGISGGNVIAAEKTQPPPPESAPPPRRNIQKRETVGSDSVDIRELEAAASKDPFYAALLDTLRGFEKLGQVYLKVSRL